MTADRTADPAAGPTGDPAGGPMPPDRPPITSIGVVVPAHDEGALIGRCLRALAVAAARVPVPVRTLVVLDDCSDTTADRCRDAGVEMVAVSARCVGMARAAGMAALLHGRIRGRWLATTDADSAVDPDWLAVQLDLAADGVDAVAGVVRVEDWEAHPPQAVRRYEHLYAQGVSSGAHEHVHGASLGLRATAYQAVGGFPPVVVHEDRLLVEALEADPDLRVLRTDAVRVTTSARTDFRAGSGFGQLLLDLADPRTDAVRPSR